VFDPDLVNEQGPAARLSELSVDVGTIEPAFDPNVMHYQIEVDLLVDQLKLYTVVGEGHLTVRVNDQVVPIDDELPLLPLRAGANVVTLKVEQERRPSTTYQVNVKRGLDAVTYIKASNSRINNWFGYSIAVSGDTMVVGAPLEDSAAAGVNGNADDTGSAAAGAVFVFVRAEQSWVQQAYIKATNTDAGDHFGESVALDGDTLVVGAPYEDSIANGVNGNQDDDSVTDAGAVYVYARKGTKWTQESYIKPDNTSLFDNFGKRVAVSGDIIAVSSPAEDGSASGINLPRNDSLEDSGAVYVFQRTQGAWSQQAYIKASNNVYGLRDGFGEAIALDGRSTGLPTLVVGAPLDDSSGKGVRAGQSDELAQNSGAIFVFVRVQNTWQQQVYIKASNAEKDDEFGRALAIHDQTLLVGAPGEDSGAVLLNGDQQSNKLADAGAAYLFGRNQGVWSQQGYLKASNPGASDNFGRVVEITPETLLISSPSEDSASRGLNGDPQDNSAAGSGAVYVWARPQQSSLSARQILYAKAPNATAGDFFGSATRYVAGAVIVGAQYERSGAKGINGDQSSTSTPGAGAVYVFR